jgi:uncharacterized protein YneF (UPF0154 family)
MKKRMIIMLVLVGLLLGGIVGFNVFKGYMMQKYMASAPVPAATVSAATDAGARAEERDVDTAEARLGHLLHRELAAGVGHRLARRARRRERHHARRRELPLLEDGQHLATHRAGGTRHRHDRVLGHLLAPRHATHLPRRQARSPRARRRPPVQSSCEAPERLPPPDRPRQRT